MSLRVHLLPLRTSFHDDTGVCFGTSYVARPRVPEKVSRESGLLDLNGFPTTLAEDVPDGV